MRATRRAVLASALGATTGCLGTVEEPPARSCPVTVDTATARIGFTGDVMLGRNVNDRWADGPPTGVWGNTLDRLQSLDGTVGNLECCVADGGTRRPFRTYYFRADPDWAIPALAAAGISVASLANNHVLDFGPAALAETRRHLEQAGIAHPGAGPDRSTAFEPAVTDIGGVDVAVVACTDQSPSYAATRSGPGTAYTSLSVESARTRQRLRRVLAAASEVDPDLVVATLHWGPNWEATPSEEQQQTARWLVDHGVDVVHGHSAHVLQGVETHHGRPIIYDAGDFVDDYVVKDGLHNDRSFLFELVIEDGRVDRLRLTPVEIVDERVRTASERAAKWLRGRMRSLSSAFETTIKRDGRGLTVPLACAE
ncbi:poly-gamma-glutamate biosynthesis protein [Halobacteriales archaeon QS_4_62_28]|nr:MAG: poly-gamma-glutamate biosynthesis protein [Halobacteriales archaeon QS_4_62_28]